ncbi:thiol-disulfide oxidoreductase [Knoellia sinensis KCTC 19936]|uniref:Thiol-disulfide oxidoreductase n=1 Tax=Knoellia sinensis KCTC 19936 TaxID=1385520 RepID=A0A0A0J2S7_9MICO|nr:DCC1-like thiol-disulfide oxidoreductase family protein [Knoellia sinensis]KGN31695.1 thiol-disulfide oxidoreductase [Knoellia sinensis KCTC 19936]
MHRLYVLHDPTCPICRRFGAWLVAQPAHVPITLMPAGGPDARAHFPALDHAATMRDITVVSDVGDVWTKEHAWVVALWATRTHRATAERLATRSGLAAAKRMAYAAAGLRAALASPSPPPAPLPTPVVLASAP